MMRWIGPLAVFIITAVGAHWATLQYTPSVIMDRTLSTLKNRGISQHAFTTPQRISPSTQVVVRTSPDLFYSLCRYDLCEPGSALRVTMGEWPDYQSLSFFDGDTNNFQRFRGQGETVSVRMVYDRRELPDPDTIVSPTPRGVVLIRRQAPTQEAFDAAKEASKEDMCALVTR